MHTSIPPARTARYKRLRRRPPLHVVIVILLLLRAGIYTPAAAQHQGRSAHTQQDPAPISPDAPETKDYLLSRDKEASWYDTLQRPSSLTGVAQNELAKGNYFDAMQKAMAAVEAARSHKADNKYIAPAYNLLGTSYSRLGNLVLAVHNYLNAASWKEKIPESPISLSDIYNNIGTVMPDKMQALQYFDMAYRAASEERNNRIMGMSLQNKSLIYEKNGDYEKADHAISESYHLGQKTGDKTLMYVANMRWCNSFLNRGAHQKALAYLRTADSFLAQMSPAPYDLILHQQMKGEVFYLLGDYMGSEKQLLEALAQTRTHSDVTREIIVSKSLAKLYEKTGDYPGSLLYFQNYIRLKDSVLNEMISQGVSSLEIQYRIREKDKALAFKEQQVTRRNYLLAVVSGGGILLTAGIFLFFRQQRKMQLQGKEISQMKATMQGEEQERIRIARELHDGIMVQFSSVRMNLNTVADTEEATPVREEINGILHHLDDATRELRRSAHNLMPDMLLAEGLNGAIQYFCASISQRSGVLISFQQNGNPPKIGTTFELMLYRIIQELVQNAMKHAHADYILVQLDTTDKLLTITVEDNGVGMRQTDTPSGSGLKGIRTRIEALRGTMEITSSEDLGTTIYIELEINILQQEKHAQHAYIRSHS